MQPHKFQVCLQSVFHAQFLQLCLKLKPETGAQDHQIAVETCQGEIGPPHEIVAVVRDGETVLREKETVGTLPVRYVQLLVLLDGMVPGHFKPEADLGLLFG